MRISNDSLQNLAERMRCGDEPHCVREKLEASLIPMVRRALRSGAGLPQLVQWVQTTLPQLQSDQDRTRPVDPDRAAPPLARLLCAKLLDGRRPARLAALPTETVVGV
jgi:hypothetical protein